MSDIRQAFTPESNLPVIDKKIGIILVEFYEHMKAQEKIGVEKGGKQATIIVMAINDIKEIIT
jgi:hypothetical protein